ncbi:ribulose-phosphate 3-epimerase [Conexibacter sp. SYSU D00693]|uniref:ribulose-phosphate 3-epimerase n=1 Tax=Conexibacter sp. SYSU D00693 TaxID=2812560 RepID=UPI00196BA5C5|nr:ribulose-phosphate 3-epimerase [Conexibacter sp. SYSU D00693]
MPPTRRIAPSILSADFARLGEQVQEVVDAGASVIHVDVMDGRFVPPITMGPLVVEALRGRFADVDLDVHLMIADPERQVEAFASAGASGITFHAEATAHVHRTLDLVREHGCRAGLAVNPATPLTVFEEVEVDLALLMTVNPGWGGQRFIPASLGRLERLRAIVGPDKEVEVDGGVDAQTAGPCADAGASLFVAGSAVFGAGSPGDALRTIAAATGAG